MKTYCFIFMELYDDDNYVNALRYNMKSGMI